MDTGEREPSEAALGEARRHLLELLRGMRDLDAALGAWRPDYGGLPARPVPDPGPPADVAGAHRRYAAGLLFFSANPALLASLGDPARGDIEAAIADAQERFGAPAIPLEALASGGPQRTGAGDAGAEGDTGAAGDAWGGPPSRDRGEPPAPSPGDGSGAERRPRSGVALWIGVAALLVTAVIVGVVVVAAHVFLGPGPTAAPPVPTVTPATLPPDAVSTASLPNVLAPAQACTAIPSGQLPAALAITATSSGIGTDPATGYSTPYVTVTLAAPVGAQTPSFTLVTAVLPYAATAPASGIPVDRAGIVQLIAAWDGGHWYAALRSWSGAAWSTPTDTAAQGVDVVQKGAAITVYWQGLHSGDQIGEIVAAAAGCAGHDLSANLTPTSPYAG